MGVVARLKKEDLLIKGYVDERSPNIKNGLVKYFPFDGTTIGQNVGNIIDPEKYWKVGTTGSQGIYTENGAGENAIMIVENPWGREEPIWACIQNDAASNDDGGWNAYGIPVDKTKRYRFSVWVKRENPGDGIFHFGCQHSSVCNLGTTTVNVNPYFVTRGTDSNFVNDWVLAVAYVHPYDYAGGAYADAGVYKKDGTKMLSCADYKWTPTTTFSGHRVYQYYSTSTLEKYFFCRPRMEICNGDECSIQDLLNGTEDNSYLTTSATNLTVDGLAIEEGTTNLMSIVNGRLSSMDGAGTTPPTVQLVSDYTNPFGTEAWKITFPANPATGFFGSRAASAPYPFSANLPYSTSVWVKIESGKESGVAMYHTGAHGFSTMLATGRKIGEWAEYKDMNYVPASGGMNYLAVYVSTAFTDTTVVHVGFSQAEQKTFVTAPTVGTLGWGSATIPLDIGSDFSIGFRFTPSVSWARMFTVSYSKILFQLRDKNTGKSIHYTDYHSGGTRTSSEPWFGMENFITNAVNGWHWHDTTVDWSPNKEYWFMITKQGTTWKKHMTSALGFHTSTMSYPDANLSVFTPDLLTMFSDFSARYQDLVIYNRALSVDEAKSLFGSQLSLDANGNANVRRFVERPLIPSDAIYYPLSIDGYDSKRFYTPSEETSVPYDCGSAWVGTGTVNHVPNPTGKDGASVKGSYAPGWDAKLHPYAISVNSWSQGYNSGVPSPAIGYHGQWVYEGRMGSGDPCIKFIDRNDLYGLGHRWLGVSCGLGTPTSMGWAVGTVVTISWWQKSDVLNKGARPGIYHMQTNAGTYGFEDSIGYVPVTQINRWERASFTFTVGSNWTLSAGCSVYVYGDSGAYGTLWVDDVQVEARSFATPFVDGSYGAGSLEFNLNATHGLNWSGNWTIAYWKKPVATHSNDLVGYNIESLGCNANTVGGGYVWFGKEINANKIASASPGVINPAEYFNQWYPVTLVKNGGTLTITSWGIGGVNHVATYALGSAPSTNYYVTQYGYDFKMGGWDNAYPVNTHYKDLIILKRAMTAGELTALIKTNMRAYKDKLNVTGIIREGSVIS